MYYTFFQCITIISQSEHQCLVIPVKPVNILKPVNNLEPKIILEPGGRRRPDLYADIPVPVLQGPAGEEGEPGGVPNFLKEKEKEEYNQEKEKDDQKKEEDDEEKKEKDEKEEEIGGKRRDEEDM
jgi:hypothetical protein